PAFGWAFSAGSATSDVGQGLVIDPAGNICVAGKFGPNGGAGVDFDPGPGVVNLTALGYDALYVAKYTNAGALIWADSSSGPGSNNILFDAIGFAQDPAGNLYLSGDFQGTEDFDPGPGTFFMSSPGSNISAAYFVKLGGDGHLVWAKEFAGPNG